MITYTLHVPLDPGVMPDAACVGAITCEGMRVAKSADGSGSAGIEFTYRLRAGSPEESLAGGVRILEELARVIPAERGRRRCEEGTWTFRIDSLHGVSGECCLRYTRAYGEDGYAGPCQVLGFDEGRASLLVAETSFYLLHARMLILEREIMMDGSLNGNETRVQAEAGP